MKITCRIENGNKIWRNDKGEISRKNGPAVISRGNGKYWYQRNLLHRVS